MKRFLLALLSCSTIFALSLSLNAQTAPVKQWDKTLGASNNEVFYSLQQTTDGGYILGGYSNSGISGDKTQLSQGGNDYWVIKLDGSGSKVWDKTFGGNGNDILTSLQQATDGGYILGGHSFSGISGDKTQASVGDYDYWVIKLDATGNKQWDKRFGGNSSDFLGNILQTSDGGYILGGQSSSNISGDKSAQSKGGDDYWIVKLDGSGNKVWDKTFGGTSYDDLNFVQQTADNGFILGGSSSSPSGLDKTQNSQGLNDYWIIKLDAGGNKVWDKTYGGAQTDLLISLLQTMDGGYFLGGYSDSGNSGDKSQITRGGQDFWVLKLDTNGNKLWDRSFGGTVDDELTSIKQTFNGNYIIGGLSNSGIGGDKSQPFLGGGDYWLLKLDSNGNKIWDTTLGGKSFDRLHSIGNTADAGYILGGFSSSGIGNDKSESSKGGIDFWVVKLAPDVLGVDDKMEDGFKIFPNPTYGIINLELSYKQANQVSFYNSLGQCVFTKNLMKTDNEEHIQIDLSNEAKGVYTIQVLSDKQVTTRKVVLQ